VNANDRRSWANHAKRYAQARWCWDDCDDDIQTRAHMEEERPDEFIDRMASKWDLSDPSDPWVNPSYDAAHVERLRARITRRFGPAPAAAGGQDEAAPAAAGRRKTRAEVTSCMVTMTLREMATVLAALRYWQRTTKAEERAGEGLLESVLFTETTPLNDEEIDGLAERVNGEDSGEDPLAD
jgi:hypothetical protein